MADQVPGIQASFELDSSDLVSALAKVKAELDASADRVKAVQKALEAGSATAMQYAQAVAAAARETAQLNRAADQLNSQLTAQKAAVSALANNGGGAGAWGTVMQQSAINGAAAAAQIIAQEGAIAVTIEDLTSKAIDFGFKQKQAAEDAADAISAMSQSWTVSANAAATAAPMFTRAGTAAVNSGNMFNMTQRQVNGLTMGMMQLGYVVDDIQYGFQAVVNNIAPLVSSFATAAGASGPAAAGIAAAAQVIGVVAYQAYQHWDDLMDALDIGIPIAAVDGLDTLATKIKAVDQALKEATEGQKRLNAEQVNNIITLQAQKKELEEQERRRKEDASTFESIGKGGSEEQKKLGGAFNEVAGEIGGGPAMQRQIAESLKKESSNGKVFSPFSGKEVDPYELAKELMVAAKRGDRGAYDEIRDILNSGGFHSTAGKLTQEDPRTKAEQDEAFKEQEDIKAANKKEEADKQKAEVAAKKAQADAEKHSRENVAAAKKALPGIEVETEHDIEKAVAAGQGGKPLFDAINKKIADRLKAAGFSDADATAAATAINSDAGRKVAENKVKEDIRKDDPDFQRQQRAKAAREGLEAVPGIDKMAEDAALRGRANGVRPAELSKSIQDGIKQALVAAGIDPQKAAIAAKEIDKKAEADVQKDVVDRQLHGGGSKDDSKVDIHDAADMNARLQRAVGGNDSAKEAKEQREKMLTYLATIAGNKGNAIQLPETI